MLATAAALLATAPGARAAEPAGVSAAASPPVAGGPAPAYRCAFNGTTDAYTGAHASASAIGWAGNRQGVVTCLGGTFVLQDGIGKDFGFGIYGGGSTTWTDADGYLPAQITRFHADGAVAVAITEFADRVVIGGHPYVAVYCRVAVHNDSDHVVEADPGRPRAWCRCPTPPTRWRPMPGPTTTTWWPPTASGPGTRGRAAPRWPRPAASTTTSRTWPTSGVASCQPSPRSTCPTASSTTPTGAGFILTQIARTVTTSTLGSTATRASSAMTSSAS